MTPTIQLNDADSYEIEGRIVQTTNGNRTTRYVLPSGARISLVHWKGTSILETGGLKTITARVVGPRKVLTALRDALV